jgi:phenylalanyl-tRNA synthetase beta chain
MKFLYHWIKELLSIEKSAEEVSKIQMTHSFENVVVGKILEIKKHPNADKLQLVKVDVGTGHDLSIVCGAHNISVGDKVPVAMIGAKLPGGEIKEAEIRGEKSFGMLCAEDELGLGTDHSGIMILDSPPHQCGDGDKTMKQNSYWCGGKKAEIGMEFANYINKQ